MKFSIDTEKRLLTVGDSEEPMPLYSKEAFELLSECWIKVGWDQKYPYTFSWLGRPIIQLPEDMIRIQEVIWNLRPTCIVETGVAHGGSLVFYASLMKAMGIKGRILGVDLIVRPHNHEAISRHILSEYISLIIGDSISPDTVGEVARRIQSEDRVLVILDSNHTKNHVARELEAYHRFVTSGSYIVATDGVMRHLHDVPRGNPEWLADNPASAAEEFAARHPEFVLEQPAWAFNESLLEKNITHWPSAWLRRNPADSLPSNGTPVPVASW